MVQLDLDPHDAKILHEMLEARLSELFDEIAHTDARDYKEMLREKRRILERVVSQLQ